MTLCYRLFSPGVLGPGEEDDGPGALDQEVGHDALELGLVRVGGNLLLDRDADVPLGSLAQHTPGHTSQSRDKIYFYKPLDINNKNLCLYVF